MTETTRVILDPRMWVRITEDLREKLASGVIAPGDTVSITLLAEQRGTARETVAKALRSLKSDGLVKRYPGLSYYALSHR